MEVVGGMSRVVDRLVQREIEMRMEGWGLQVVTAPYDCRVAFHCCGGVLIRSDLFRFIYGGGGEVGAAELW